MISSWGSSGVEVSVTLGDDALPVTTTWAVMSVALAGH